MSFLLKLFPWALILVNTGCVVLVPFIEPHNESKEALCPYTGQIPVTVQTGARAKAPAGKSARYVNRYIKQLQDKNAAKRSAAATYLGRIGPDAAPAIPALIERLNDDSKFVRRAVVKALGKIERSAEVEAALRLATADRDRYVAQSAENALGQLRVRPAPAGSLSTTPVYVVRSNKRVGQ